MKKINVEFFFKYRRRLESSLKLDALGERFIRPPEISPAYSVQHKRRE
jgi:hypothetical protein